MKQIEVLGIIATIILIISMSFNCKTKKSLISMRILNTIATLMFIVYSCVILAYSTILSNVAILIIDVFYLFKLFKNNDWDILI